MATRNVGASNGRDGVSEQEALTLAFEGERAHLLRVAYAITGTLAEAEDCVQESWLRLQSVADPAAIRDLHAWLTTAVSRLALDAMSSAQARRERYVGPWLPEPLVEDLALDAQDPAERVELDEAVSMALLIVLERLSVAERTAFILHDVFGLSFEDVAAIVGRSPVAVRQLASRARKHVEAGKPRFSPTYAEQREIVIAFIAACQEGDVQRLLALLDPDVVWRGDGGGKVIAAPAFMQGAENVARVLVAFARRPARGVALATVNGAPGLVMRDASGVLTVISFTLNAGRIIALDVVRNPDKLRNVPVPPP